MKKLISCMLLVSSFGQAALVPATVTKQAQASKLIDVRERTALEIKARTEAGYHFASVDMDGADFKTEKVIMKELQALGYTVRLGNDHHVFGHNALNGALVVIW